MSKGKVVAVAGVTGAVGVDMLRCLEQRKFPVSKLVALASARSVGKTVRFQGEDVKVQELRHDSFKGVDIALFSAGADRSKEFAPSAVKAGAVVVDNSSYYRMDASVPLIVPEVNAEEIKNHKGIIANPNCTTIIMVVPLWPLHKVNRIKRVVVSSYQAASGAGAEAMQELIDQTKDVLAGKPAHPKKFVQQIAFNLFPHIDKPMENGYTKEEMKMVHETRKIMGDPEILVSPTTVRVPVLRAHSESLNLEFSNPITPAQVRAILEKAPGVQVIDDLPNNKYPMPILASDQGDVLCGRIREDVGCKNGIAMFICGDQLLKGAALNAVQIAEYL